MEGLRPDPHIVQGSTVRWEQHLSFSLDWLQLKGTPWTSLHCSHCPRLSAQSLGSERFLPSPPSVSLGFIPVAFLLPFWALLCCPFLLSAGLCWSLLPAPTFFFLFILYPTLIEST